jgi:hypothetical protein
MSGGFGGHDTPNPPAALAAQMRPRNARVVLVTSPQSPPFTGQFRRLVR